MATIRDCMKRNVVSVSATATVREAAALCVAHHIGSLPVVDAHGRVLGVLGVRDLLTLELPAFINLIDDVDFVHSFGAVETTRPSSGALAQPVTSLMHSATTVPEDCGLLRAYALMLQRELHDLPVVAANGILVGIVSRVDVATAVLAQWQSGEAP